MAAAITELSACPDRSGRTDPVSILEGQARSRVAELIGVRNARMAATTFTFYRGAAAVMTADLASTPGSGVYTQLCGDAHLSNFGVFNTPERRMIFDLNDFDETSPGPFEWDVKRLAASFVVAGRQNGFDAATTRDHAAEVARWYRRWIRSSVSQTTMDTWYARIDVDEMLSDLGDSLDSSTTKRTAKGLRKARHRNSIQAVGKLCVIDDAGRPHIRSDPPLLVPVRELFPDDAADIIEQRIASRLDEYRKALPDYIRALVDQFRVVDVARKVVGVGSVGMRAWIVLMCGRDANDPLFLQLKEAQPSVLVEHIHTAGYPNQGQRVVEGQRLLQAASDLFLGWTWGFDENGERRDFYVRQLRDGKGSVVVEALTPEQMSLYARLCARTLAQAHARTASRHQIAEYLSGPGKFATAIADFAEAYADLNEADHHRFTDAIATGRLESHELI
ncbi:DUF2252 domain-containing protein [Gordonia sp. CPCC 206044]|uniref:DUF2252 domain-containing protein n=1 Tax=Gordonia sp. CPCC 206044 TaxID=3140793 RepID=UPI003AF3FEBC